MIGPLICLAGLGVGSSRNTKDFSQIFLLRIFSRRKCCIHHHPSILQALYFGYIPRGLPQIPWVFFHPLLEPQFFFINGTLVCFWGCGGLDSQIQFPRLNPQPALRSTNIAGLEKQPHLTFEDVFPIEDWQNFQPLLC